MQESLPETLEGLSKYVDLGSFGRTSAHVCVLVIRLAALPYLWTPNRGDTNNADNKQVFGICGQELVARTPGIAYNDDRWGVDRTVRW